jgi:hypothetical protein
VWYTDILAPQQGEQSISTHHQQPAYSTVQKLWQKIRARKNYYHHRKTMKQKPPIYVMGFSNIENVQAFPKNIR